MAIQYENEFENDDLIRTPIYVGFDGSQGEPLDEVLQELESYRQRVSSKDVLGRLAEAEGHIAQLLESEDNLSRRIESIWNKLFKKPIRLWRFKDKFK